MYLICYSFIQGNLVIWSRKRQTICKEPGAEAEYRAMAHGVARTLCLTILLQAWFENLIFLYNTILTTRQQLTLQITHCNMTGQNILRSTVTLFRKGFSEELFLAYVPSSKLLPNVFTKEF